MGVHLEMVVAADSTGSYPDGTIKRSLAMVCVEGASALESWARCLRHEPPPRAV